MRYQEAKVINADACLKKYQEAGKTDPGRGQSTWKVLKVRQDLTHFGELRGVLYPWAMGVESHGKEFELHPKGSY